MAKQQTLKLRYTDDYLRQHRAELQAVYEARERSRILQEEIQQRFARLRRRNVDAAARIEHVDVGAGLVVFRLESDDEIRLYQCRFEIIGNHAVLETPYEVRRNVTYTRVRPSADGADDMGTTAERDGQASR